MIWSIAADNAQFGQTGPRVGSFDGGLWLRPLARLVGQRKAREIWFLCRRYNAEQQALAMGLVNTVFPSLSSRVEGLRWRGRCCSTTHSDPLSQSRFQRRHRWHGRIAGIGRAGHPHLFYRTEEGQEGRNAFRKTCCPDFSDQPGCLKP